MKKKKLFPQIIFLCFILIFLFPLRSFSQHFPSKPITLYVGYAPGASTDITARALATEAERFLGVPVVVENKPGGSSAVAAGLLASKKADGYTVAGPKLAELVPELVVTSISNFGSYGPYRDFLGDELVVQALGGLMNLIGDPQREPLRLGGYQAQYSTALMAFLGTMAALNHRDNTGYGQQVEVSAQETVASIDWKNSIFYQSSGKVGQRGGSGLWTILPSKDGFVGFVYQKQNWPSVVDMIGDERLTEPRFATQDSRIKNREELRSIIGGWTKSRSKLEIYHEAQKRGIPVGMVSDMADLVASPQYAATASLATIDHPSTGPVQYPGFPCTIDGERLPIGRAPLLGEHNMAIYRHRIGLTTLEICRLREANII